MTARLLPAASVLLARAPDSPEVFLVRRADTLRFLGGFWAFPGGKVHDSDSAATKDPLAIQRSAAARELFEETGVLLARRADGSSPPGDSSFEADRRALLEQSLTWPDFLAARQLSVQAADLVYAGSLVTPPFAAVRFDTAFFVAALPARQEATIWPGELTEGVWNTANELLADWQQGGRLLSPPTISLLEAMRGRPVMDLPRHLEPLLSRLERGALPPIWFSPGVAMLPVRSQALPPSTHTNAYLIGADRPHLLDPGCADPAEQGLLFTGLDELLAGRPLSAIVLTHHHPDHTGAAAACAARYGAPLLAHPTTAQLLAGQLDVYATLNDGDRLDLGRAPDGTGNWRLEAVFTPGHAPGHLAFFEPRYGLLFVGDTISTLSSVVIAPPEGDLAQYLDSLHRLAALPSRLLLPAHGSASTRPAHVLAEAIEHRRQREGELLAALGDEPLTVAALARVVYRGLPAALMPYAEMQILAGLQKLRNEGRAATAGEGWRRLRND